MGLKALGLTIVGLAKNTAPAKNIYSMTSPFKRTSICADKFIKETKSFNKEELLAKICADTDMAAEEVFKYIQTAEKNLEPSQINYLMELASLGKIKLCTPAPKKRMIFLMNRNANDGLILKQPKGVLNYVSTPETALTLKELLVLEKEGKLEAENIAQLLKLQKEGYPAECAEFITMLKSGEAKNNNVNDALLMAANEIPFEILNPKNLAKYSKDELREYALVFQSVRGKIDKNILESLRKELSALTKVNSVSKDVSSSFLYRFDKFADTFANSTHTIEELAGAGGIQLSYSRDMFKSNVLEKIKTLSEKEQKILLDRFGLSKLDNGRMSGLPVHMQDTSGFSKYEIAVNEEIGKFLNQNKIILPKGFEEFSPVIEEICKVFPEFRFTIGSNQHKTHSFALAEHILSAFQQNVKNPLYKELSSSDKKVLGIATLLHDINKIEKVVDRSHPLISSQTTEAIVQRMEDLSTTEKNRIINFVENHHWLEKITSGNEFKQETAAELAMTFRSGNDFKMAKIFAESDLKSVNPMFWSTYGSKINSSMVSAIEQAVEYLQANGRMVFTADVTLNKAINAGAVVKTIEAGGKKTKNYVIDAKSLGLDKENVIYHAALDDALIGVISGCGHKKGMVLSASLGREGHLATFRNYPEIVGFRQMNMNNIGAAFARNTKYGKGYEKFGRYYAYDKNFPDFVRKQLSFEVSDKQYGKVFNEVQDIGINEIHSNKSIQKILGGEAQALEFEKAVINVNKGLESTAKDYNEVVICDPEVGFVGTKRGFENIDYELRKFCEENNILIVEFH